MGEGVGQRFLVETESGRRLGERQITSTLGRGRTRELASSSLDRQEPDD